MSQETISYYENFSEKPEKNEKIFNKFGVHEVDLIDNNFLIQEGFLKKKDHKKSIKIIDSIQFKKKLQFKNFKVTPGAKKRIEELGGSAS